MNTEEEYDKHKCFGSAPAKKCTRCGGKGKITQILGPAIKCSNCNGSGYKG